MNKRKETKASGKLTPEQVISNRRHRLAAREEVISFISNLIWMVVLLMVVFGLLFGITPMKSNDMAPRISSGDLMLYYRLEKNLRPQDIVIFEKNGRQYTGRIVAKGGDIVEITEDSQLKINNSTVVESNIFYTTPRYGEEISYPVQLKEEQYFILSDYRIGAKDSRYFGPVERREMKGKVLAVLRRSGL